MAKTGYEWWIRRLKHNFTFYDVLRIDHFRGLESYYAIPYGDETARGGQWKPGPGMDFIRTVQAELPDADVIAEDLGFFTEAVQKLLADSAYPGMKLLEFAFDARERGDYSPYTYGANTVVYTGTHDNDTVEGWGKTAPRRSVRLAMEYMGIRRKSRLTYGMIRLAMQTAANLAIIPMQDWLRLGSEARMNTPSTLGENNWRWRLRKDALTGRLADTIARMTTLYGREVKPVQHNANQSTNLLRKEPV
jgi:4-alpha-glucanotransferase